jgi:NADH dehydrogenase (ubiquinone) Fe-S protein 4
MYFIKAQTPAYFRVGRLVSPVNTYFVRRFAGTPIKADPSDAPTSPDIESSLIRKEIPSEPMPRHELDYDATIDHGTSCDSFTPSVD